MKKEDIISKARPFSRKNFLTRRFRRYYLEYCKLEDVTAHEFLELVEGNTKNSQVINFGAYRQKRIRPAEELEHFFSLYENEIVGKASQLA